MSEIKLFTGEIEDPITETAEIIAGFSFADGKRTDNEKGLGFEHLDLVEFLGNVENLRFKGCPISMNNSDIYEEDLMEFIDENLDPDSGELKVSEFVMNEYGDIEVLDYEISLKKKKNDKTFRRFFLVNYQNDLFLASVRGLNDATMHYKDGNERNETGLQFGDIVRKFL